MQRSMTKAERLREMERLYFQRAYSDIQMAERLGVNRSTAFRDRQELELAIPFIQDEQGRWQIDRRRYLSNIRVNLPEALSLYLAARRTSQQTRFAQTHVASALEKLALALRQPMTARLVQAADRILAQQQEPQRTAIFETVATAWSESRRVRLVYRALRDEAERVHRFAPYLLEPSPWNDGIYLIGQSDRTPQVLTLKLDRIVAATLLGPFEPPADFDEEAMLRHAWGIWGSAEVPQVVKLRFAPGQAARRLRESIWHPLEKVTEMEDGSCVWQAPIAEWQEMVPWVRGWGASVEVLEPESLRKSIMREIVRLNEVYQLGADLVANSSNSSLAFIAHTANPQGRQQSLEEHLHNVALLAQQYGAAFDAGDAAYVLGWWHDLGKFHPDFQAYLHEAERTGKKPARRVDHKAAGAIYAQQQQFDALALLIQGHHGGLQNGPSFKKWIREHRERGQEALSLAHEHLQELADLPAPVLPVFIQQDARKAEFFLRMLFSTLVDADFLDTEAHFSPDRSALRGNSIPIAELWEHFHENQRQLQEQSPKTPVNTLRSEIYQACVDAAQGQPGLYRLTVPTGGGKTRSALAFALRHAQVRELERVIVAVPYISITEQTAQVYRDIFSTLAQDTPIVLEHHSGAVERIDEAADYDPNSIQTRLASENWDAPVVVTTTVQLFESLFANQTSRCRKLHNLARSVIILDEVQALPVHLLDPILDGLQELVAHYGTTVLLSTATQPAFETLPISSQLDAQEINPDPVRAFRELKRVDYDWQLDAQLTWDEIAALMADTPQALAVLNTKKDALALLDALDDPNTLHLSTQLCGAHRRMVLDEVKRRLAEGEPCRLISTQVVEAGVDLDFPLVLRALGPLSSIIQAAGRANREGKLPAGRVIIFDPIEGGLPPGGYKRASQTTETLLHDGPPDMDDPATVRHYFNALFQIEDTDREGVQTYRNALDYIETARRFRMIADDTLDVVVGYGSQEQQESIARTLDMLRAGRVHVRGAMRRLQPFLVSLYTQQAKTYRQQGLITEVIPGLGEWHGAYDPVRGIVAQGPDAHDLVV